MSVEDQLARAQQQLADCAVKINNQRAEIRRLEAGRVEVNREFQVLLDLYNELRRETCTDGDLVSHTQAVEAIRSRAEGAEHLRKVVSEYEVLFELQRARIGEADQLYCEAHPLPGYPDKYLPDLGRLIQWLLEFHAYVKGQACDCYDDCGAPRKQPCDRCRLFGRKIVTYRTKEENRVLCLQDMLTMAQRCQAIYDYLVETQGCSEPPEAIYHSDPNGGLQVVWDLFWAAKQHFTGLVPRLITTPTSEHAVMDIVWEDPEEAPANPRSATA